VVAMLVAAGAAIPAGILEDERVRAHAGMKKALTKSTTPPPA
jgi:hypothetical protein